MGSMPIEQEVAPVLGMAKKGPIDKYKAIEKNKAKCFETGLIKLSASSVPVQAMATTPNKGKVTAVKQKPKTAIQNC